MRWNSISDRLKGAARSVLRAPATALLLCGCAALHQPAPVAELKPGRLIGYLPVEERIDAKAILPAPPPEGSAEAAADQAVSRAAVHWRDSDRWRLAIRDANVSFPEAAGTFSCALGAPIDAENTPYLYQLLRRVASDAGYAGDGAKALYRRNRPFVINKQPPCTPEEMHGSGTDRSYPSGHSATGTAWTLLLVELAPDRAVPLLKRGQAFAESRVVCNMHWQSDTIQGRFVGVYSYTRLQASAAFRADMQAARAELAALRARNLPPTRDCQTEAKALDSALPAAGTAP
jgi:acid phosphatase (class A)